MAITLSVNGIARSVDVDGDTPLLWVLRDVLGMTGTKFGCGIALCGACTVHLNGAPTLSCITSVDSIGDASRGTWLDQRTLPLRLSLTESVPPGGGLGRSGSSLPKTAKRPAAG